MSVGRSDLGSPKIRGRAAGRVGKLMVGDSDGIEVLQAIASDRQ